MSYTAGIENEEQRRGGRTSGRREDGMNELMWILGYAVCGTLIGVVLYRVFDLDDYMDGPIVVFGGLFWPISVWAILGKAIIVGLEKMKERPKKEPEKPKVDEPPAVTLTDGSQAWILERHSAGVVVQTGTLVEESGYSLFSRSYIKSPKRELWTWEQALDRIVNDAFREEAKAMIEMTKGKSATQADTAPLATKGTDADGGGL